MHIALDARYICDHFPGIGRYTYNLAQALAHIAPDHRFILLHNPALPNTRYDLSALTRFPNVELVRVDVPTFSLAEQYRLPFIIRHSSFAILHSPYYIKPYLLPCPSVVTIYDIIAHLYPKVLSSAISHLIFELTTRLALRTSERVLTISEAARRDLMAHYRMSPERVVAIPLAADPRFGPQSPQAIAALRRKYNLPERYVLYFGSNKPHKNLVRLVEAFGKSQLVIGHWSLAIGGHWDPRYPEPKQRAEELGITDSVMFLGPVPDEDLPALYTGATLFVFPSLYEGFGLPPLEAMACGTPVVCSNTSSLPEVVGEAAIMVEPLDVEGLAAAMERLLGDQTLREETREKGLAQAAKFSWEHTAQKTMGVYESVVQSP